MPTVVNTILTFLDTPPHCCKASLQSLSFHQLAGVIFERLCRHGFRQNISSVLDRCAINKLSLIWSRRKLRRTPTHLINDRHHIVFAHGNCCLIVFIYLSSVLLFITNTLQQVSVPDCMNCSISKSI